MLTALVLVCSLGITPDLAACDADSAVDVMQLPAKFASPATCFMQGQAYLAETVFGRNLSDGERVKVVCTRRKTLAAGGIPPVVGKADR